MIVSIHQPSYFPWLGLLDKIAKSGMYILMDEVQLSDSAYQHRNIFHDINGNIKYLTVPILKKGYLTKTIKDITLADNKWQEKHRQFLISNYSKHPYFDEVFEMIQSILNRKYYRLIDVLQDTMTASMELFNIKTIVTAQSRLHYDKTSKKSRLIYSLLRAVKAETYLCGQGARDYMIFEDFEKDGIEMIFQDFDHPVYPQQNSINGEFHKGLSCLDMLFNLGIEEARKVFWKNIVHREVQVG